MKKAKKYYIILGVIQIVIAICFIIAGIVIESNIGDLLTSKLHFISNVSFSAFIIPDHFILAFHGFGNLICALISFQRYNIASYLGMFFGTTLILWFIFQIIRVGLISFLQPLFLVIGIIEIVLSISIYRKRRKYYDQMLYH
ncbi:MAG: hypothetical protein M0P66_04750 [Salinivirgaceae bacterium]|nr:hypothetical protein [Salinivirgaceae bacterium]